ncbi:putative 3-hydroxyisobutyrate dehydrogenase, mitochondrial [Cytospora mali]|uniref:3-hydroxyisobutyrate dehydrogenase, mitochondrial n=1 Tax=Cytospora mali TaxID=578113 RepID=A0A194VRT2_CYTMA|nr:putative 3-hydroxyisobutyrate dehydrogenase, mitochondrial [Valsa mali]
MAQQNSRLGWIGLGSMGLGMATNLQKHLSKTGAPNLQYNNRTMSRGEPLQKIGGVPCGNMSDLVEKSDIIFMSLSDDSALEATLDSLIGNGGAELSGKIIVDTSTVLPSSTERAQTRLAEKGARLVAAPVFGASPVAAQGNLLFVLAGPEDAIQAISPFLVGVMGRGVIRLGEDVKQSSMLKTAGNFMTAAMMEVVAEAHVLAEKTGLGSEAMESLIEHQYGPLALSMSKRLTAGAYMPARGERPWSDLTLALKDVGHGISCADESGSVLPVGKVALEHLQEAKSFSDAEGRPLDSSSMYGVLRRQAGLSFETDLVKRRDGVIE